MYIDFIFNVFKDNKSNISIIWKGNEFTYKSLINNIEKSIHLIDSNSIKPGTVVALKGDFSPNSIALLLALIEKAYAKLHGCYGNLISGYIDEGIQELTGFQPEKILIRNEKTGCFPNKMIE